MKDRQNDAISDYYYENEDSFDDETTIYDLYVCLHANEGFVVVENLNGDILMGMAKNRGKLIDPTRISDQSIFELYNGNELLFIISNEQYTYSVMENSLTIKPEPKICRYGFNCIEDDGICVSQYQDGSIRECSKYQGVKLEN